MTSTAGSDESPPRPDPMPGARLWAITRALPLWAGAGFDESTMLFHERLDFDGRPIAVPALRLMVQARQIATFARMDLLGWRPADERALTAMATVERLYHRADGAPGWIFAVHPDGSPADLRRDLYAHAFILYALAWSYRRSGDLHWVALADITLSEIDAVLAAPYGGWLDASPATDAIRRQNPHMHLMEALLALFEATGHDRYLSRAQSLATLAGLSFIDAGGALLEDYDAAWRPLKPHGENRVEPGHLFEWAWLFHECRRLGGDASASTGEALIGFGRCHGFDAGTGLIVDAITETGAPMTGSFRTWPHAEAVKAFSVSAVEGGPAMAAHCLDRMMAVFAPDHLGGGWIDRIDADGRPLVDHMPASTLYHIIGALAEADRVARSRG